MNKFARISLLSFFLFIIILVSVILLIPKEVKSAGESSSLILFWDGDTIPDGWTCISCNSTDDFYQRFIRGSDVYGTTGGNNTHTHTYSSITVSTATTTTMYEGTGVYNLVPAHTHAQETNISQSDNIPVYRTLKIIRFNNGIPSQLPEGIIAMFNSTSLPNYWVQYTEQNNNFIKGDNLTNQTGGKNTHNHTISTNLLIQTASKKIGNDYTNAAAKSHTHYFRGTTNDLPNIPPFSTIIFAKLNTSTNIPLGMIALVNGSINTKNWLYLSNETSTPFYQKFIIANSTYNQTGGSNTHLHSNLSVLQSGGTSVNVYYQDTGTVEVCAVTHQHTINYTNADTPIVLPPYIDVIVIQNINPLTTTLISPVDTFNSSSSQINFSCNTSSSSSNITNISLYGNWSGGWHLNYTNKTDVPNILNETTVTLTYTLEDGVYLWNCLAEDNSNNSAWGNDNFTFLVDTTYPNITLNSPTNLTTINQTTLFNCTGYDNLRLKNISFYTNLSGVWAATNSSNVTNTTNTTTFGLDTIGYTSGTYKWSCGVCDSASNCNTSFIENRTFIINKSIDVIWINGYLSNDLNTLKFYNNITFAGNISSPGGIVKYVNFSVKDPNGVVRIYNVNGTQNTNIHWNATTKVLLNVSGTWVVNVTTLNELGEGASKSSSFNISDVVGYLSSYQHSTTSTEKGGNISYNLTLWHDTDECFNYSISPWLNYSNNFTIYTEYDNIMVCKSDIYTPYKSLITIYINSSSTDGIYIGNISINRTNTSTLYVSTINLTVNPPTAIPYLYDSNNVYACQSTKDGNCSWEAGNKVGVFKSMYYYVQNLGDYNASKCNLKVITNETMWDYAIDLKDFTLNINESKKIKLDIRVTSGYGETKQAYVGITCDNSTPYGYAASTSPSNNPIIYWMIDALPQSNAGSGGGGGSGATTTPAYICDNKNMSWKAEADRGGGSYSWLMMNNSLAGKREGKVIITNLFKTNTINIKASCFDGGYIRDGIKINDSNICEYLKLDKTSFKVLPTAEQQTINFYVNISTAQDYKSGDKIYASILLKDIAGCEYYFPITITMSSQASALSITALVNKLFMQCKVIANVCFPYWAIFLISLIVISALVMIVLLSLKVDYYVAMGILTGVVISIIILLLI